MNKIGICSERDVQSIAACLHLTNVNYSQSFYLTNIPEGGCEVFSALPDPFEGVCYLGLMYGYLHLKEEMYNVNSINDNILLNEIDYDDITFCIKLKLTHLTYFFDVYSNNQGVFKGVREYSIQQEDDYYSVRLFIGIVTSWHQFFNLGYTMAKHSNFDFIRKSI